MYTLIKENRAIFFTIFISLLFLILENINGRFTMVDYEVYHRATIRLLHGDELYKVYYEDTHYIYKYSPVALYIFIPFTIFPLCIAKYLYWIFLTACICFSFRIVPAFFDRNDINQNKLSLVVLFMALHFTRELHLGQVNYLIFFMYLLCVLLYKSGKSVLFGLLLCFTCFIKPFGFIFLPYLIIKKKYKEVLWFSVFLVILFVSPFLFYHSYSSFLSIYQGWIKELLIELSHKQSLLSDSNHTIFSVVARYTPIKYLINSEILAKLYQLTLLGVIATIYFFFQKKGKDKFSFVADLSFLIALIPLLAFTSENAFCFTCFAMILIWISYHELKIVEKMIAILGSLVIGFNYSDIFGRNISTLIDQLSLISLGAIMLLFVLFQLRRRSIL